LSFSLCCQSNTGREQLKCQLGEQRLQVDGQNDQNRLLLEQEIRKSQTYKGQVEVLSQKLKVYEDKIKRQEQYLKSKILKDRTNAPVSVGGTSAVAISL
jgi:hypothetical protein